MEDNVSAEFDLKSIISLLWRNKSVFVVAFILSLLFSAYSTKAGIGARILLEDGIFHKILRWFHCLNIDALFFFELIVTSLGKLSWDGKLSLSEAHIPGKHVTCKRYRQQIGWLKFLQGRSIWCVTHFQGIFSKTPQRHENVKYLLPIWEIYWKQGNEVGFKYHMVHVIRDEA